jgi:hypothetical protein
MAEQRGPATTWGEGEYELMADGHVVHERARLEREHRWSDLVADVTALIAGRNQAGGGHVRLMLDYLLALGERPAASGNPG